MSQAVITTITLAVETALTAAAAGFSQTFVPVRTYDPVYDSKANLGLKVFVGSINEVIDLDAGTRGGLSQDLYTVQIGVFDQIARDPTTGALSITQLDADLWLLQQIKDYFKQNTAAGDGVLIAIRNAPVYDRAQLDKTGTFYSIISLDYRLLRSF